MLDIGGGFPARYDAKTPELAKICAVINKSIERFLPYPVELWTEPGRFLVANAGMAVGSITGREERSGESWLYTDIGTFGGLMEALEFPGGLNYPCYIGRRGKLMWGTQPFTVTGPTCDAFDTLYYSVPLAKNAAEGDRLYIEYAGAYTLAYASTFNGFAMPKTYYI
jgi:ornithine decarboxylase